MERKQTPGKHWDREQWAPDAEGHPAGSEGQPVTGQDEVWNRHQWSPDNTGTEEQRVDPMGSDATDIVEPIDDPAVSGLSGQGQPSGESHWERNDPSD